MAQQVVGIGAVPNDGTGDALRVGGQKINSNFQELYSNYSKTVFAGAAIFTGTKEQKITAAIAAAVVGGLTNVLIPLTMLPYNPSLVTFNAGVQLIREGGNPGVYDVDAYGAAGDGVTDDLIAINAADANAPAGAVVQFGFGKTYALATLTATHCLLLNNAHRWDLNGATIKYTGVTNVTTGTDGAAIPLLAVLRNGTSIINGTIDGNSHCAFPIAFLSSLVGPVELFNLTIQNTLEASSTWNGMTYAISQDVTGIPVSGRAAGIAGTILRPNCPLVDQNNTITGHALTGAILNSGAFVTGNATGSAFTTAGTEGTIIEITNGTAKGVPTFISNAGTNITNNVFSDLVVYDLGTRHQERYGAYLDVVQRQTFSSGGAYTPGWLENGGLTDSPCHVITVSANVAVTIANPTNGAAITVDRIGYLRFFIRNTSGGALTTPVTFTGANYKVSGTVSPGNNQQIVLWVVWDKTTGNYAEVFRSPAVGF